MDTTSPVYRPVDKKIQRAGWIVGKKNGHASAVGVSNLTRPEAPGLEHFGADHRAPAAVRGHAVMGWLRQRRFLMLLVALLLLIVAYPVAHETMGSRVLYDALLTVVFLAAFFVLFTQRRHRLTALLFGVPTLVGAWTGYVLPDVSRLPAAITFHVLAAIFFGVTIAMILRVVFKAPDVSADSIYGAMCGYLLVGLAFGHLYCVVGLTRSASFRGSAEFGAPLLNGEQLHYVLTYFSFVTLTTVGYGDIMPASAPARALAVTEAIVGQFYLAVLIAGLVGKWISQAISAQPMDGQRSP
jgi:voltage-gated potassium channel